MANKPNTTPLAVTMGEPAGIGPELIARLWEDRAKFRIPPFVYVGAPEAIRRYCAEVPIETVVDTSFATQIFDTALPCIPVEIGAKITPGQLCNRNGATVIECIETAVELALDNEVSGIVTAPIHKAALYNAGFDAPGHTEFLAKLCGVEQDTSVMMLSTKDLRAVPVTIHIPLHAVPKQLTASRIVHCGMVIHHDLQRRFGIAKPRIAVAGLNPHAGESGTIGIEEATHIKPAIWELRDNGIEVSDPLSADTLFHEEARSNYDAVLCMYHDQALIPVKTLDFWGGVNTTLGLPIIRTSPDHGTALELAGTGKARIDSMVAAVRLAADMAAAEHAYGT